MDEHWIDVMTDSLRLGLQEVGGAISSELDLAHCTDTIRAGLSNAGYQVTAVNPVVEA